MKIPKTSWVQNNYSDVLGNIWKSFNLDLTSMAGKLRISPRMIVNITSDDNSDFGIPCAAKVFPTSTVPAVIWVLTGDHLFLINGGPEDSMTKFSTAPHPGDNLDADYSDMEIFNGELYLFSTGTTIQYMDSTGATTALTNRLATGAGLHDSVYFRAQNRLYVVDNSSKGITSIDTSRAAVLSTSGNQYSINNLADANRSYISWIAASSTRIWIGTLDYDGTGYIYAWDGSQVSGPNEAYALNTTGTLSCVIKDDVPWVIDTEGRLLAFNGGTFVEVDRFPVDLSKGKYLPHVYKGTQRLVHYNGMTLVDNKINILANTAPYDTSWPASTSLERMSSGIWEYTKETGLYHKASLGTTKSGGTITDYGQSKLKYVGCLAQAKVPSLSVTAGSINGTMIAGGEYYTNASSSLKAMWYDDFANTLLKAGHVVTQKIFTENVKEQWQRITMRMRKFLNANDKVVIKYRTEEDEPTEATITYTSTTTFTVPTASFSTAPAVGDEVEILQGAIGAGRTCHITTVTTSAPNYVVTVDETITGATTQTAIARFQTWKKLGSYNAQTDDWWPFPMSNLSSTWIQFKIWILWTGKDEIHDFILTNAPNQKAE